MSGDHNMNRVHMNQKSDSPDWNSYKQGWDDGVTEERQRIVNLLMIQHDAAKGAHNYWHVAASLIKAESGENV